MTRYVNYMQVDPATGEKSYGAVPVGTPIPDDAWEVDAQPSGNFEAHDPRSNAITTDIAAKADAMAGRTHIDAMHIRKAIEASLILAGYEFDGVISAEAAQRSITQADLAAQVKVQADVAVEREIERISMKNGLLADNRKEK